MPKKFGINTKKQEAQEKKVNIKKEKEEKELAKIENEFWKETDEKVLKKLNRAKEKEQKRIEIVERKKENKELVKKEEEELNKNNNNNNNNKLSNLNTISKYSIQKNKEEEMKKIVEKYEKQQLGECFDGKNSGSYIYQNKDIDVDEEYVNNNFLKMEEYQDYLINGIDVIEGSDMDALISKLNLSEGVKHPEKRMKAAWKAYIDKNYSDLKNKNPKFRRHKILDILSKEFHKSMDNPMYVYKIQKQKEFYRQKLLNEN